MKLDSKKIKSDSILNLENLLLKTIFTNITLNDSCENLTIKEANTLSNDLVNEVIKIIFSFNFEEKVEKN